MQHKERKWEKIQEKVETQSCYRIFQAMGEMDYSVLFPGCFYIGFV